MTDLVVETFSQETIEDVEGSIAAFFLGLCGQGVVSLDEETDSLIQDSKLYGQDYDLIKVLHKSSQSIHIIQTDPFSVLAVVLRHPVHGPRVPPGQHRYLWPARGVAQASPAM